MPPARRDEPRQHQRQRVRDVGEPPDLRDRQPAARERTLRLVHAIDLEIVDLVQRVVPGVQQRRHRGADERRDQERGRPWFARRGADCRERAGDEAERGRDERERAAQVDVRAERRRHRIASATTAATAVLMKLSMSLFRIPGPSSVAPSALSTRAPAVAPTTTMTMVAAGIRPSAAPAERERHRGEQSGRRAFERHRAWRSRLSRAGAS